MTDLIELDVSGRIFRVYRNILTKSELLRNMLTDTSVDLSKPVYLGRSPIVFEEVLAYMISDQHPFPTEYVYELDYFLIPYTIHERDSYVITKTLHYFCDFASDVHDMTECNERSLHGESYCTKHKCSQPNCHECVCILNDAKQSIAETCMVHKCARKHCTSAPVFPNIDRQNEYCAKHKCLVPDCRTGTHDNMSYCKLHTCTQPYCRNGVTYIDQPRCSLTTFCYLNSCDTHQRRGHLCNKHGAYNK